MENTFLKMVSSNWFHTKPCPWDTRKADQYTKEFPSEYQPASSARRWVNPEWREAESAFWLPCRSRKIKGCDGENSDDIRWVLNETPAAWKNEKTGPLFSNSFNAQWSHELLFPKMAPTIHSPPLCNMNVDFLPSSVRAFSVPLSFVTPWTVALQAPLSIRLPRQE